MNRGVIGRLYDWLLRPYLPTKISVHNGVPVCDYARLFDVTDVFPTYEGALIKALRSEVELGDEVVVIGGGLGVSSVVAAQTAGISGSVQTYEASPDQYRIVQNTVELNKLEESVEVRHAVVGRVSDFSADKYAGPADASRVEPADLPRCDVLELDCEGAELEILAGLEIRPRSIVVETHGFLNAPEEDVEAALGELGYTVTNREVEDAEREISILTAHLS